MHNISNPCKIILFEPIDELFEQEANFLEENFEVVSINYTDDGKEEYVCYALSSFDEEEFNALIKQNNLSLPDYRVETLEDKNWLTENVIKFAPYEVGEFLIYGIHETVCPKTDKIPVQVYAATAFGSEHQTTRMCLEGISYLKDKVDVSKILDMGTGSGILSIGASKMFGDGVDIVAVDIDQESVDVTKSNTITNNRDTKINTILSDGYNNPFIKQNATFDIIFANILANPLKEMCKDAYMCLREGGYYLISGFIDSQEDDIINHHKNVGFEVVKIYQLENWRAIILQK